MSESLAADLLEQIDRLTPAVSTWLREGFARWRAGEDLDKALGLRRRKGQRLPETLNRQARRDELLRAAWMKLPRQKPWPTSLALAERIGRLDPAYRRYKAGYHLESEVNRLLCAARDNGPLPTSPSQVHFIINSTK